MGFGWIWVKTSDAGAQADADQAEECSKAKSETRGVLGFGLMELVDWGWVNARVGGCHGIWGVFRGAVNRVDC